MADIDRIAELTETMNNMRVNSELEMSKFREAANDNNQTIRSILRDLYRVFTQNQSKNTDPTAALEQLADEVEGVKNNVSETNSLLQASNAIQNQMLDKLGGIESAIGNLNETVRANDNNHGGGGAGLLDLLGAGAGALEIRKLLTKGEVKTGEVVAESAVKDASVVAEGAAKTAAESSSILMQGVKYFESFGKALPIIGDGLQGIVEYFESGSLVRGIGAALGSAGGRIVGAAGGTAVGGPIGGLVGEVGGSVAGAAGGASGAEKLWNKYFGSGDTPQKDADGNPPPVGPSYQGESPPSSPSGATGASPTNIPSQDSPQKGATGGKDDINNIIKTIRTKESGGNYTAANPGSSASGAYQFLDSTWQGLTKQFGIGQQYGRAAQAPAEIQDQIASKYAQDILKRHNNDVSWVPREWYAGPKGVLSPSAQAANGGMSVEAYQKSWDKTYQKVSGGKSIFDKPLPNSTQASPKSDAKSDKKFDGKANSDALTGKSLAGVDGELVSRMTRAASEYYSLTGKKVNITSGYRDSAKQKQLYDDWISGRSHIIAAKPGRSLHEKGLAIDSSDAEALDQMGLLHKYGLGRPVRGDPVHIQMVGTPAEERDEGKPPKDGNKGGPAAQGKGESTNIGASPKGESSGSALASQSKSGSGKISHMMDNPNAAPQGDIFTPKVPAPGPMPSTPPSNDSTTSDTPSITAPKQPEKSDTKGDPAHSDHTTPPPDFIADLKHWIKSSQLA